MRFWRAVPRLLVGFMISAEMFAICRGPAAFDELRCALSQTRALLGEGTNGVFLAIAAAAIAAAGSEVVRAALLPLRFGLGGVLKVLSRRGGRVMGVVRRVSSSPAELASDVFEMNKELIHGVYRGSSLAAATEPAQYALVEAKYDAQFQMIEEAINRLKSAREELWRLAYFGNVAQEQAFADFTESIVESIQVGWVAIALLPVAASRLRVHHSNVVLLWTSCVVFFVLSLPHFIRKKLTLATYLVHSFVMVIQFGRLAELTESDMLVH